MQPLCTIFPFLAHCDVTDLFQEDQIKNSIDKEYDTSKKTKAEINEKLQSTFESVVLTDKIPEFNVNENDTGTVNCSSTEIVELDPYLGTLSIKKSQNNDDHEIKAEDVIAKNSELIAKINQELLLNADEFKNINSRNQETDESISPEKVLLLSQNNGDVKNQISVLMTPLTGNKHALKICIFDQFTL